MRLLRFILLFPFSLCYGIVVQLRNLLFDYKIFKTKEYNKAIILVGNLTTGGTGKTPHVETVLHVLKSASLKAVVLSRGYGRSSRGFRWVNTDDDYRKTGDEPLQIKLKYPEYPVAVDGNRKRAISRIIKEHPETDVIVMDDGFQHRAIRAGMNILLIDYEDLNRYNCLIPSGTLREPRSAASRADVIIVSKTPSFFSPMEKRLLKERIQCYASQEVFFSYMVNGELCSLFDITNNSMIGKEYFIERNYEVLLITGIAKPAPFIEYVSNHFPKFNHLRFSDHHKYSEYNAKRIVKAFNEISSPNKIILTTEKDAMRLRNENLRNIFNNLPLFCIRVDVKFHQQDFKLFHDVIVKYARQTKGFRTVYPKRK